MFEAYRGEDRSLRNARLLVSVILRHPEIGTVNYDPKNYLLRLNFLIRRSLTDQEYSQAVTKLRASLDAFYYVDNRQAAYIEIDRSGYGELTVIELIRDIRSVSLEEIALMVEVLRGSFKENLLTDRCDPYLEEDPFYQEELVEELLEDLQQSRGESKLIAIREEGRVFVFNK